MQGGKDEDTSQENFANTGDGECKTQLIHVYCENKMDYNREEVVWAWLSVVLSKLAKGTILAKKKLIYAEMIINT